MATIWMFSGQGSQYFGMGRDLYDADPVFRQQMELCSELARPVLGGSLIDIIFDPGFERFAGMTRLLHSHPALFSIQYSLARTLLSRGLKPDAVLGYSLGEVVALAVAGSISLEEGLTAVLRQAGLLESRCPRGAMLAVLSSPDDVHREPDLYRGTHIAADNFDRHFVLSGTADAIDVIERELTARAVGVLRLPVDYPFHSPLVDPLEAEFRRHTADLRLTTGTCTVLSACRAGPLTGVGPDYFWELLRQPVRFKLTIERIERDGPNRYVDLGPSGTLATFIKYNRAKAPHSEIVSIITPFGGAPEKLAQLIRSAG